MKTPKPNWKKKYEETAGLLKLARDGNELLKGEMEVALQTLKHRPTIEKEVLPYWVKIFSICLLITVIVWQALCFKDVIKAEQPIEKPHEVPVVVQGGVSDEIFNSLGLELISCKSKLMDCNRDYRHMRQEGCNP